MLSLVVQAAGGAMAATADTRDTLNTGTNIMITGVSLQVAVTVPFMFPFADFHVRHYLRYLREGRNRGVDETPEKGLGESRWTKNLMLASFASAVSTLFILIRCIYRVVEMAQGWSGYLATHEVYFAALDGIPITIALAVSTSTRQRLQPSLTIRCTPQIFVLLHPGFLFPDPEQHSLEVTKTEEAAAMTLTLITRASSLSVSEYTHRRVPGLTQSDFPMHHAKAYYDA